jgi:catechol 2,3-dioxygenase-like lactoylglutathione lyase family enzyme
MTAENTPVATVKPTLVVGIIVSDLASAKAFYGGVLGLKEDAPLQMPDGTTMIRFVSGTTTLKLRAFPHASKHPGPKVAVRHPASSPAPLRVPEWHSFPIPTRIRSSWSA